MNVLIEKSMLKQMAKHGAAKVPQKYKVMK
jgi:hypothetical protein